MNATPSSTFGASRPASAPRTHRLVVDAPTRMFHGLFALSFAGAYLTAESEHWRRLHVTLGYVFAGLLLFRLLYGTFGPRQAGLGLLWRRVAGAPAWLRCLLQSRSLSDVNWRQGQNLAMALAIVWMLVLVVPLVLTGYGTYNDWGGVLGGDGLEEAHEVAGNAFLMVVLAHLALMAALSLLRRQNQALPMITGRVSGPGPDLVRRNRVWLAGLMLLAVVAFGVWQWQDPPRGWIPIGQGWHAPGSTDQGAGNARRRDPDHDRRPSPSSSSSR